MASKKETTEKEKKAPAKKAAKPAAKKEVKKAEKAEAPAKVKKAVVKAEKPAAVKAAKSKEAYFYGVGRRKTSVAQVRVYKSDKATDNDLVINDKKLKDYFPSINHQNVFLAPLKAVGVHGNIRMTVLVRGGGVTGQVEASSLGISRALVAMDETFKKTLKDMGMLTRDARKVERKKPGLKKARRAPQWAKR